MKSRITSIFDTQKKRTGAIIVCMAAILTLGTGAAFASGALSPVASSGVPSEFVFEGALSRPAKPGSNIAYTGETAKTLPDDEAEWAPLFENWKDFLTYDYDLGVYLYDGKWVRSTYDEWRNPAAANGMSGSLTTVGYNEETGRFDDNPTYGTHVDIRIIRNLETNVVEKVEVLTIKELKQIIAWQPVANEMDFDTYVSGGK